MDRLASTVATVTLVLPLSARAEGPVKSRFADDFDFVDESCGFRFESSCMGLDGARLVREAGELVRATEF